MSDWKPPEEDFIPPESDLETSEDKTKPTLTQVKTPSVETDGVEPTADVFGLAGAGGRGAFKAAVPMAVGGGVGFALGGPPLAAVGAVGLPIATALGDLTIEGVNAYFGTDYQTASGALTKLLDSLNTPKPDTAAERITEAVTEGLVGGAGGFGLKAGGKALAEGVAPRLLSKVSPETLSKVEKTTRIMGEKPLEQMIVSGVASGAASGAQEAGYGPAGAVLAGIGTPLAYSALKRTPELVQYGIRTFRPTEKMIEQEAEQRLRGLYQYIFNQRPEKQKEAVEKLRQANQINDDEVKLLSGALSGDPGLLAVQKAAEKTSIELADRKMQNIRGISNKIDRALLEEGASPEEVSTFFQSKRDELNQIKDDAIEGLDKAAQEAYTIEVSKANDELLKQQQLLDSGVISAQEASDNIEKQIGAVGDFVREKSNVNKKNAASVGASNVILKQREAARKQDEILYGAIKDVAPFQQANTKEGIEALLNQIPLERELKKSAEAKILEREFGKSPKETYQDIVTNGNIPQVIRKIYLNIVDGSGNLKQKEFKDLKFWRSKLNEEIENARRTGRDQEKFYMQQVKSAIDEDLKNLGEIYPQIKEANKFHAEYKDIFDTGAAEKAFEKGRDAAKVLDEYIASPKKTGPQELERLRRAIAGHPRVPMTPEAEALKKAGLANVDEWVYAQASDAMGKTPTSQSLINWKNKNGDQIFKAFEGSGTESENEINKVIGQLQELEKSYEKAKEGLRQVKAENLKRGREASAVNKEAEYQVNRLLKTKEKAAKQIKRQFIEATDPRFNPANRFIGGNAESIIGKVMDDADYGETNLKQILAKAAEDPTGKALEGIKNAARQNLLNRIKPSSKELVPAGMDDPVLRIKNLQADINSANDILREGSPQRKAIELIFGKNSKELNGLDKARYQLSTMTRKPEVTIPDFAKLEETPKEKIIDNLMGIGGIAFGGVKGYVAWKSIDLIRKFQKQTKQDVASIFSKLLIESLYDPEKAIALTEPITTESFPMIQKVLKNAGIAIRASDIGLEEPKDQEQPEEE